MLYCPDCRTTFEDDSSAFFAHVTDGPCSCTALRCPVRGCYGTVIDLDENMIPIVDKLYKELDVITLFCCSGHYVDGYSSGYISMLYNEYNPFLVKLKEIAQGDNCEIEKKDKEFGNRTEFKNIVDQESGLSIEYMKYPYNFRKVRGIDGDVYDVDSEIVLRLPHKSLPRKKWYPNCGVDFMGFHRVILEGIISVMDFIDEVEDEVYNRDEDDPNITTPGPVITEEKLREYHTLEDENAIAPSVVRNITNTMAEDENAMVSSIVRNITKAIAEYADEEVEKHIESSETDESKEEIEIPLSDEFPDVVYGAIPGVCPYGSEEELATMVHLVNSQFIRYLINSDKLNKFGRIDIGNHYVTIKVDDEKITAQIPWSLNTDLGGSIAEYALEYSIYRSGHSPNKTCHFELDMDEPDPISKDENGRTENTIQNELEAFKKFIDELANCNFTLAMVNDEKKDLVEKLRSIYDSFECNIGNRSDFLLRIELIGKIYDILKDENISQVPHDRLMHIAKIIIILAFGDRYEPVIKYVSDAKMKEFIAGLKNRLSEMLTSIDQTSATCPEDTISPVELLWIVNIISSLDDHAINIKDVYNMAIMIQAKINELIFDCTDRHNPQNSHRRLVKRLYLELYEHLNDKLNNLITASNERKVAYIDRVVKCLSSLIGFLNPADQTMDVGEIIKWLQDKIKYLSNFFNASIESRYERAKEIQDAMDDIIISSCGQGSAPINSYDIGKHLAFQLYNRHKTSK